MNLFVLCVILMAATSSVVTLTSHARPGREVVSDTLKQVADSDSVAKASGKPVLSASAAREEETRGPKLVGRILLSMKADEAAKILGRLSDEQIEGVLRQMGARSAGALLAKLPPERAALLSQRLLGSSLSKVAKQ